MKTILSVLFIVLFSLGSINAQNKMSLGAGLVVSFPMGDFSESANTGFGGTAIFELGFMSQLVGIGQIGYVSWGTEAEGYSYSAVPILVGVKYFFIPGIGFYGTGQLGLSIFSIETPSVSVPFLGEVSGGSVSSTEFTFVIGAGYQLPVGSNVYLDFNGTFNLISDLSNIQLWAGAKFGL